jgi:hypothetical protein
MILRALTNTASAIEVGATYRRSGPGTLVEVARVLEIGPDKMGIPHVRFELTSARGPGLPLVETRTLGLEAFQNRFKERLQAQN